MRHLLILLLIFSATTAFAQNQKTMRVEEEAFVIKEIRIATSC